MEKPLLEEKYASPGASEAGSPSVGSPMRSPVRRKRFSVVKPPDRLKFEQDPFAYPWKVWTPYNTVKVVLMCVFMVPLIRLLFFLVFFTIAVIICVIATIGLPRTTQPKPMAKWRRWLVSSIPVIAQIGLKILGFWSVKIKGKIDENVPVIVANHSSIIDAIVVFHLNLCMVVAASFVRTTPFFGTVATACQAIFVDRENKNDKDAVLNEMKRRISYKEFPPILIFPEGCTTNNKFIVDFKRGAFSLGVPIQPVVMNFRGNKNFNLSWTAPGPSDGLCWLLLLCQIVNYVEITILPVYYPSKEEEQDPRLYSENVRKLMAQALGGTCLDHTVEDSLLLNHVLQTNPRMKLNILVKELKERFDVASVKELKCLVNAFSEFDTDRDGFISFSEFCKGFKLEESTTAKEMFDLLDTNRSGQLDFAEFCWAIYIIWQTRKTNPHFESYRNLLNSFFKLFGVEIKEEVASSTSAPPLSRRLSFSDFVQRFLEDETILNILPASLKTLFKQKIDESKDEKKDDSRRES